MVIYKCPTCLKEFDKKDSFVKHTEKKKKPCRPNIPKNSELFPSIPKYSEKTKNIDILIDNPIDFDESVKSIFCEYCNKNFSTKFNLNKHIKYNCKQKKIVDENIKKENEENKIKDQQIQELIKKLDEQSKKIDELSKNSKNISNNIVLNANNITTTNTNANSITNTNTNNINNTNTNNIKLVAHGSEDLSDFDIETVLNYLCTVDLFDIIPDAVKDVYLNDDKPENKNFRVTDMSRNKSEYYDGKNWIVGKADEKILKIFENINDLFIGPFMGENYNKTMNYINQKQEFRERLRTINSGRNFCRNLYSETDKDSINNRNNILEELKLLFYNFREQITNKK